MDRVPVLDTVYDSTLDRFMIKFIACQAVRLSKQFIMHAFWIQGTLTLKFLALKSADLVYLWFHLTTGSTLLMSLGLWFIASYSVYSVYLWFLHCG
jgi:hypothetical protein